MTTEPEEKPEEGKVWKRTYQIDKILEMRQQVMGEVLRDHHDKVVEGDAFEELVDSFCTHLPDTVPREAVYDSVFDLAGERITKLSVWEASWRLAGNLPHLRNGNPVTKWSLQREKEWVPAQIISAKRRRTEGRAKKNGWLFTFQVLAGTACPMKIPKFWTDKFCYFIKNELGFNKRSQPPKSGKPLLHIMRHPTEFVNLRMFILLDPELDDKGGRRLFPEFEKVDLSGPMKKWNRTMMKRRDRMEHGYDCPMNFGLDVNCHQCFAGYKTCPAATHRLDYKFAYCNKCSKADTPFDPDLSNEICLHCVEAKALGKD